ncbi:MAG TPA: glycosyltransferase family 2 protein, partial [Ktedonobacteraceae bacterium]|nr:glycosyltransferase family 2 protein [Ktedonobacteraceae bacterium]
MIGYRSKKLYTLANCEMIVGGVASTYRASILKQVGYYDEDILTEDIALSMKVAALGNKENRIIYAANVVAMTEGVHSFRGLMKQRYRWKMGSLQVLLKYAYLIGNRDKKYTRSLTFYRLPMALLSELILLLQPILLGYLLTLCWHNHSLSIFLGAYATVFLYVLWTVLPDEHSTMRRKLYLSMYAPFMYLIFYIMDVVQISAIVRCLINPKQIARKSGQSRTWVSPERAGQTVNFS